MGGARRRTPWIAGAMPVATPAQEAERLQQDVFLCCLVVLAAALAVHQPRPVGLPSWLRPGM